MSGETPPVSPIEDCIMVRSPRPAATPGPDRGGGRHEASQSSDDESGSSYAPSDHAPSHASSDALDEAEKTFDCLEGARALRERFKMSPDLTPQASRSPAVSSRKLPATLRATERSTTQSPKRGPPPAAGSSHKRQRRNEEGSANNKASRRAAPQSNEFAFMSKGSARKVAKSTKYGPAPASRDVEKMKMISELEAEKRKWAAKAREDQHEVAQLRRRLRDAEAARENAEAAQRKLEEALEQRGETMMEVAGSIRAFLETYSDGPAAEETGAA